MEQYIQRFRNTRLWHRITLHNCFVSFRTSYNVVRLNCKNFLKNMCGTEGFQCPNFHFSETLTTKLSFTTQRLLSNQRVRTD